MVRGSVLIGLAVTGATALLWVGPSPAASEKPVGSKPATGQQRNACCKTKGQTAEGCTPMKAGMMGRTAMSPEMMRQCQAMMATPIFLDSPCAIYGQADRLKLTEEQKKRLAEIENGAREQALTVLTPEQRKQMGDVPDKPMAMMQMCRQACGKMMPKMMGGKGPMMMCPMMNRTADDGRGAGKQSAEASGSTKN